MLATRDPREAYRRSDFDARVTASDTASLVHVCLEQAIAGLGGALISAERNDPCQRSRGLTRALTAVTALEMGVDRSAPLAGALLQVYGAARSTILRSVTHFDAGSLGSIRQDFVEIANALKAPA